MKTIYFTQRTTARFFAVFAMFSLLAGMVPTQAFAAQVLIFSASANPTSIGMGQTVAVTFTIGNSASSNKDIKALRITVPSGFSASNFLISQPNWSVALNSGEIQGSLNSGPTGLTPGSQLTVTANITNVSATTATSWQTCTFINSSFAPGAGGDFNIVGGTGCGALAFSVPPTTGTLTVTKVVVNTGGGTKVVSDFPLFANANSVTSGVSNILAPATYTVTETNSVNYTASFSTSCPNGVIALAVGENKTCTITNTYVAPPIACTAPFTGFQPNCVPPPCPQGQTGTFPNCVTPPPPSCSDGILNQDETTVDTGGVCTPAPVACTAPFTGFQPNCVPPPCPQGQIGIFPACVTPPPTTCTDQTANNVGQALPCTYTDVCPNDAGVQTTLNQCTVPPTTCTNPDANNVGQPLPCTFGNGGGPDPVLGCTDRAATNYNQAATSGNSQAEMCDYNYASQCGENPNLLVNASFETPTPTIGDNAFGAGFWQIYPSITGWATTNGIELWSNMLNAVGVHTQSAELDTTGNSTISQSVATIPGATYQLRFDFAARSDASSATDNSIDATADTNTVASFSTSNTNWTTHGGTFVADGDGTTNVSFADKGTSNGVGTVIDNAVLCLVRLPEPAPVCKVEVVSDTSNTVNATGTIVVANQPGSWVDNIVGSVGQWIWGAAAGSPIDPLNNESQTFTKTFVWNGPVTSATLQVAADNFYSVKLNGVEVASTTNSGNFTAITTVNLPTSGIVQGTNTLEITATNLANNATILDSNPAGLLYDLTVSGNTETDCTLAPVETPNGGGGGGGHGGGHRKTPAGDVLGAATSSPEVLGDQVSAVPAGAPNAGAGSTSPFSLGFFQVAPVAFLRRARIHG